MWITWLTLVKPLREVAHELWPGISFICISTGGKFTQVIWRALRLFGSVTCVHTFLRHALAVAGFCVVVLVYGCWCIYCSWKIPAKVCTQLKVPGMTFVLPFSSNRTYYNYDNPWQWISGNLVNRTWEQYNSWGLLRWRKNSVKSHLLWCAVVCIWKE